MAVTSNELLQNILTSINTALENLELTEDNRSALIDQYERTADLILKGYSNVDLSVDTLSTVIRGETLLLVNEVIDTFETSSTDLKASLVSDVEALKTDLTNQVTTEIAKLYPLESYTYNYDFQLGVALPIFDLGLLGDGFYLFELTLDSGTPTHFWKHSFSFSLNLSSVSYVYAGCPIFNIVFNLSGHHSHTTDFKLFSGVHNVVDSHGTSFLFLELPYDIALLPLKIKAKRIF